MNIILLFVATWWPQTYPLTINKTSIQVIASEPGRYDIIQYKATFYISAGWEVSPTAIHSSSRTTGGLPTQLSSIIKKKKLFLTVSRRKPKDNDQQQIITITIKCRRTELNDTATYQQRIKISL